MSDRPADAQRSGEAIPADIRDRLKTEGALGYGVSEETGASEDSRRCDRNSIRPSRWSTVPLAGMMTGPPTSRFEPGRRDPALRSSRKLEGECGVDHRNHFLLPRFDRYRCLDRHRPRTATRHNRR